MKIGISGHSFTIDGILATYAGFSEFRLLDIFINKGDVSAIFRDRAAVLNETIDRPFLRVMRVFAMADSFMKLRPQAHSDFYTSVSALSDFANDFGFVLDWEALADAQIIMPDREDQRNHWRKMNDALQGRTALLSLGNEAGKNGFKPEDFARYPNGVLVSKGSHLGGDYPEPDEWDYTDYHTRRDGIKGLAAPARYLCFVVGGDDEATPKWKGLKNPCVIKEWLGAAEVSEPGRRTAKPANHYRTGFDMAAWGAGGCFHSDNGILGQPFERVTRACALAHFMGMSKADPVQRFDGTVG